MGNEVLAKVPEPIEAKGGVEHLKTSMNLGTQKLPGLRARHDIPVARTVYCDALACW